MIERLNAIFNSAEFDPDDGGRNQDIIRVEITNENGKRAVAFLSAVTRNGRVTFELVTKKNDGKETLKTAVADWLL
jgi:hypothetical protein